MTIYCPSEGWKCFIEACWNFEWALITEILETITQAMATHKTAVIELKTVYSSNLYKNTFLSLGQCGLYTPFFAG